MDDHPIYSEKDVVRLLHEETERQTGLVEQFHQNMKAELDKVTAEYTRIAKRSFYFGLMVGVAGTMSIYFWYQLFFA